MDHKETFVNAAWDPSLVALSFVVAVFASYTALDLAGRVVASEGRAQAVWLACGAFAMGTGIWSMHFTGMLAFNMGMPVTYHVPLTLLSVVIAIAASGLALFVVGRGAVGPRGLLFAGPVMGLGIASMHYTGMSAMRMGARISYAPGPVLLSVAIAVGASIAALYLSFHLNRGDGSARRLKALAAVVMGAAIVGMHYTGMWAADFTPTMGDAPSHDLDNGTLGAVIGGFTLIILGLALIGSIVDRRFSAQAAELKESEARYARIVANAPGMVYQMVLHPDGSIAFPFVSEGSQDVYGFDPRELRRDPSLMIDAIHPEDRPSFDRSLAESAATLSSCEWEGRVKVRSGEQRWLRKASRPEPQANGDVVWDGLLMDVTGRKQAEDELKESERRFRSTFEDAPIGMSLAGLDNRYLQVNQAFCDMLGYSREELLSKKAREITHPEDRGLTSTRNQALLEGKLSRDLVQKRYIHADGSVVWAISSLSLVRDSMGEPAYFVGQYQNITERKRAEEALEESEEFFRALYEKVHHPIFLLDQDLGFVDANPCACEFYGYSLGEFKRMKVSDITVAEEHAEQQEGAEAMRHEGESLVQERRHRKKNGEIVTVTVDATTVTRADRKLYVSKITDVTERKRVEVEVRRLNEELEERVEMRTAQLETIVAELRENERRLGESEERYSLVAKASNDGVFDWNLPTDEVYWNERLYEILGLSPSEVIPSFERLQELLHPEDQQRVLDALTAHFERGEGFATEFRARRLSGEYRLCFVRGEAQRDEQGNPVRMTGVVRDITERRRAEEAQRFLAEASAELSASLDYRTTLSAVARLSVPNLADWSAVDVLGENGEIEHLTIAHDDPEKVDWAEGLMGGYLGNPDLSFGSPKVLRTGRPDFYPEIPEEFLEAVAPDEEQLDLIRQLGVKSLMIVPMVVHERTLGTITLVTTGMGRRYDEADLELAEELARRAALAVENARLYEEAQKEIAERERVEEEVRRLNETLEKRVEQRTAQLAEAVTGLEMARNQADAANRAKSDFLANMSHEIRTPMNGVIGMTELLLGTDLSTEQREFAETVRASAENLLVLINDILDFSKIEAGKITLESLDFDLRTTVEDVTRMLAGRAHEKGLELISFVEYDAPTVLRGDPFRLRQVLTNLLGNAIKFTDQGEIVVRTRVIEQTEDDARVCFEITDTGIGMTEEQLGRLFQSFTQADASTTRRYGGTGLGLAISKQLVELMGGEIGARSEPGGGSTFFFSVPFEKQPVADGPRPGAEEDLPKLEGLRVLVVDDNATNRKILEKQVASWGMTVESFEDAPSALGGLREAAGREEPYDLAILDMQMPEMDGMELARAIKADPRLRPVRLIMLTSMGRRGDGEEATRAGIEAYLPKPVRQSELRGAISAVIGAPEGERDGAGPSLVTRHSLHEQEARARARVLLAEDNAVNQKVAVRMIERLGYRVDVVGDGREAIEALSRIPYAAVLMDVQMPVMDGHEATVEIRRRRAESPETGGYAAPIIAMTANAMQGDRERAIESGMDDYLPKPVKFDELAAMLERWILSENTDTYPDGDDAGRPPTVGRDDPALDHAVLDVLRDLQEDGESDILAELADLFFEDAPARLAVLRAAWEAGDAETLRQTAHALKGSCGNLGARKMAETARLLEEAGRRGALSPDPGLLDRLDAEFGQTRAELSALLIKS